MLLEHRLSAPLELYFHSKDLKPGFNWLSKNNYKTRRETLKFKILFGAANIRSLTVVTFVPAQNGHI